MSRLKVGDRVDCRVKSGSITIDYNDYDTIQTFEIVARDDEGYYIYVPSYIQLNGGSTLSTDRCLRMSIDKRFVGERIAYITDGEVYRVAYQLDGMKCTHCADFFVMAESNRSDGTFLCWSCRFNPYR